MQGKAANKAKHLRGAVAWLLLILAPTVAAACTGQEAPTQLTGPGWEAELQALREQDISELAKKILEDSVITEQEVAQLRSSYVDCVNASGQLTASALLDGGFEYSGPAIDTPEYQAILDRCSQQTTAMPIIMYFNAMRDNPQHIDNNALMAHCLVKHHVVDPSYAAADYDADLERYFQDGNKAENGVFGAPQFSDRTRGPQVHEECTSLSTSEILALP